LVDLYPTLVDLCGLPQPGALDGKSLRPLLENPDAEWNRPAITSYGRNNVAVSGERYRYIRYEDGSEELYDLLTDPHQWRNLANKVQFAEVKRRLSRFVPDQQAEWAEKSFNGITDYFAEQKRRMGTRPPVSEVRTAPRQHEQ
jgi:arylsulfatase A-like enzyme